MGKQRGAAAVELALVAIVFLALVIAVIEFAHVMFVYASAIEATRLGARIAAVCSVSDGTRSRPRCKHRRSAPSNITIAYPGSSWSAATCDPITVSIQNLTVDAVIPLAPLTFPVPAFSTSVPSESLDSTNNPICN